MTVQTWYRLDLGNGIDAFLPTVQIQQAVENFVFFGGGSEQSATFTRYDRENDSIEFYFSPELSSVALRFGARACDKPSPGKYPVRPINQFGINAMLLHLPDHKVEQG